MYLVISFTVLFSL